MFCPSPDFYVICTYALIMTHREKKYSPILRQHSRSHIFAAGLLVFLLFLPMEYVFGAMCSMESHGGEFSVTENCCPDTGKTDRTSDSDNSTDTSADAEHCDMDDRTHPSCDDCDCYFLPFSDSRSTNDFGITVSQVQPVFISGRTTPLFTISNITYRDNPKPGPGPSFIPIYLSNQVFLN